MINCAILFRPKLVWLQSIVIFFPYPYSGFLSPSQTFHFEPWILHSFLFTSSRLLPPDSCLRPLLQLLTFNFSLWTSSTTLHNLGLNNYSLLITHSNFNAYDYRFSYSIVLWPNLHLKLFISVPNAERNSPNGTDSVPRVANGARSPNSKSHPGNQSPVPGVAANPPL